MGRRDVTVRMAKNSDGDDVERLMDKNENFQWENWRIDWHDLEPNWLIAEHNEVVVGCIQVVPAKPIGRMEILTVDPDLSLMMRYAVTLALTSHAISVIQMYGAQAASSMIPRRFEDYLHGAMNRGWVEVDDGAMVMRRLR